MRFNINMIAQLSSDAKVAVLKHVLNYGFRMTGRELSRICGISHTMAARILREFEDINLVYNFKAGTSVVWMAKTDSYAYWVAQRIFGNREDYLPLEHLKSRITAVLKPKQVLKAVLFGSVAEGKEKTSSDIDLFVLVNGEKMKNEVNDTLDTLSAECVKMYGNTLNQYVLTEQEFKEKKKLALIKNIEKGVQLI